MLEKIIHVEFKEPHDGKRQHMYFGSLRAIYGDVPAGWIGIKYDSLRNTMTGQPYYENRNVIIRKGNVVRMTQRKTNKKNE